MSVVRRTFGAGPLQLLSTLASLALAAYAFTRIFAGAEPMNVVLWFAGALVLHDLVAFWLYTGLDRLARGRQVGAGAVNYVRVPTVLSAVAFVVYFPLILGLGRYERATTLAQDVYLGRWLALSGALFGASALLFALNARRRR